MFRTDIPFFFRRYLLLYMQLFVHKANPPPPKNKHYKLITYDIKDLSVNIPIEETLAITKSVLTKNNDTLMTQQIITQMRLVLSQSYFTFQNKIYQPYKGIAMGSSISSTIAEIFLQHLEYAHVKQLLDNQNIIFYTRYVDHILIVYDTTKRTPDLVTSYINQIHKDIQLNSTLETTNSISFLDLLLITKTTSFEIDIYRKPATTDTTSNFPSNQHMEHKIAAYRYHITGMHSVPQLLIGNKKNGQLYN